MSPHHLIRLIDDDDVVLAALAHRELLITNCERPSADYSHGGQVSQVQVEGRCAGESADVREGRW